MVSYITVGFGIFLILVGMVDLYLYLDKKQHKFRKYEPMKKFWGEKVGPRIHFVSYVIIPLIIGCLFIVQGIGKTAIINTDNTRLPEGFLLYENPSAGIKIGYPPDWNLQENPNNLAVVQFFSPAENENDILENFMIMIRKLPTETTLQYQVLKAISEIESSINNFQLEESKPVKISNIAAHKLVYTGLVQNNQEAKWMMILTIKEDKVYVLLFSAHPTTYTVYENTIQKMIDSFRVE